MKLRLDNQHINRASLIAVALLALGAWVGVPSPPPTPALRPTPVAWSLPTVPERHSKLSFAQINARNLWAVPDAATAKAPEWRVSGIARRGREHFVLFAFEGKPMEILKRGDTLPDGSSIGEIEADRFFVITPDKKKIVYGTATP